MADGVPVEIVALVVSAVHAFEGRPQDGPRPDPGPILRSEVTIKAGLGIVGDRYFNQAIHRNAAVTVFDAGVLDQLAHDLGLPAAPDPHLPRRNIALRGFPVDQLAAHLDESGHRVPGATFTLDSGSGPTAPPTPAPGWTRSWPPAPSKPSAATAASAAHP